MFMGKGIVRSIVIEYAEESKDGFSPTRPVFNRIISWTSKNGKTKWKELNCPQQSFHGMRGYYRTLGLDVQFYNRTTNNFHRNLPN